MSGVEFRTVTILHTEKDQDWCAYVLDMFNADKLHVKIVTLDVTSLDYENPPEIQTAIAESYVVMLLMTCHLLEYLEKHPGWFVRMLKSRDRIVTTIVATLLEVTPEELSEVTNKFDYDHKQWETMQIDVLGKNIKECIVKILELTDRNAENRAKRMPTRTVSDPALLTVKTMEPVRMIPRCVHEAGETIAIIFTNEKAKGSVTVSAEGTKLDVQTFNPYCVTFKAPEMTSTKLTVQVDVNNVKLRSFKLRAMKSPHFTSMELMCQSYGVSKKEDLDKKLSEAFISSMSADRRAMMVFTEVIRNVPTGNRNCQYPTLLHWAAANGMKELCSALLSAPGANNLCNLLNCDDDDVADLAEKYGHTELADFITEFTEIKRIAEVCDRYVQSCKETSETAPIYEDMSVNATSPALPPRKPAPFSLPPRSPSPSDEDDNYVLPDVTPIPTHAEFLNANIKTVLPVGAIGCRSQAELIEIQKEVQKGNFSIREAEMLFNSWKSRYETGNAISFKEKQQSLHAMRKQHQKHIDVLKDKCVKKKKGKKLESTVSQAVLKISDPIGMRKMAGAMLPGPVPARGSSGSASRDSHDSGRFSNRESNLSHTSTSSEEYEVCDESFLMRANRSQSERAADKSPGVRHSTREMYLELADIPDSVPPPIPPRITKLQTEGVKSAPQVKPKPNLAQKPQPPVPPKSSATLPRTLPKR